jgi:hypothetical protein
MNPESIRLSVFKERRIHLRFNLDLATAIPSPTPGIAWQAYKEERQIMG